METTTTAISADVIAEILSGDWSSVDADQLTEILTAITDAGNDPGEYAGLSDRVEDGPTHWIGHCNDDGCQNTSADPTDRESFESDFSEWLEGGDWPPQATVYGVVWPIGWKSNTTEVSVEIPAADPPDCTADEHDWTSEGEGGLSENPGVWSIGGTRMLFRTHCRHCGMKRTKVSVGAQHNPGEHDTTEYEFVDNWCAECQSEECECESDD